MSAFLTALFIIVFFVLAIILLGLYLMSKMVSQERGNKGHGNNLPNRHHRAAPRVHIIITVKRTKRMPKHQEKCLGRMKVRMWSLRR